MPPWSSLANRVSIVHTSITRSHLFRCAVSPAGLVDDTVESTVCRGMACCCPGRTATSQVRQTSTLSFGSRCPFAQLSRKRTHLTPLSHTLRRFLLSLRPFFCPSVFWSFLRPSLPPCFLALLPCRVLTASHCCEPGKPAIAADCISQCPAYYWVSFGDYGRCSQPCAPPSTTASLGVASRPSSVCWSRALSTSNPDWQCLALSLPAPADVIPCNRFPCPKPFNWAVR
jgi:hypothetical protein